MFSVVSQLLLFGVQLSHILGFNSFSTSTFEKFSAVSGIVGAMCRFWHKLEWEGDLRSDMCVTDTVVCPLVDSMVQDREMST